MSPSERDMPVLSCRYDEMRRLWVLPLPGGGELTAPNADDIPALAAKAVPGTAIAYTRTVANQPDYRGAA